MNTSVHFLPNFQFSTLLFSHTLEKKSLAPLSKFLCSECSSLRLKVWALGLKMPLNLPFSMALGDCVWDCHWLCHSVILHGDNQPLLVPRLEGSCSVEEGGEVQSSQSQLASHLLHLLLRFLPLRGLGLAKSLLVDHWASRNTHTFKIKGTELFPNHTDTHSSALFFFMKK